MSRRIRLPTGHLRLRNVGCTSSVSPSLVGHRLSLSPSYGPSNPRGCQLALGAMTIIASLMSSSVTMNAMGPPAHLHNSNLGPRPPVVDVFNVPEVTLSRQHQKTNRLKWLRIQDGASVSDTVTLSKQYRKTNWSNPL